MGGFNFGAFAGGLAQGIQKGRELALKQKQLEQDRIKQEQENNAKIQERIDKNKENASKAVKNASGKVTEATEALYDSKTDTIEGKVNIHNAKLREAQSLVDGYGTPINKPELAVFEYDNTKYVVSADMVDEMKDRAVTGSIKIQPKTGLIEYMDNENDGWYSTGGKAINENVYMKAKDEDTKYQTRTLYKDGKEVKVYSQSEYDKYLNDGFTPVKTEKGESKSPSGYDTGLSDIMSDNEKEYFTNKGLDPNNVSRLVLQHFRKAQTTAERETDFDKRLKFITEQSKMISDIYNNDKDINDITKSDISKLRASEQMAGFKGLGETEKKSINDSEVSLASGKSLQTKINKLKPEEINRGVLDNIYKTVQENISDDAWESMSMEEKEKALLTISVGTSVGNALAQYIKSISGTAVAEAEFNRLQKVFTGGNYTNMQTFKEAINTFYQDLGDAHYTRLKDNVLNGGSFVLQKMKTHSERFKIKETKQDKPSEPKDTGIKVNGLSVYEDEQGQYIIINGQKRYKGK